MTAHTVLLYVSSPEASARFYADLLGLEPALVSPPFALFKLASGTELGLWDPKVVQPAPEGGAGGGELGFKVSSPEEVDATHETWKARGATITLPPTSLGFGRSFVAVDPDGHRLRVYAMTHDV